jgi:hypothetical protein
MIISGALLNTIKKCFEITNIIRNLLTGRGLSNRGAQVSTLVYGDAKMVQSATKLTPINCLSVPSILSSKI